MTSGQGYTGRDYGTHQRQSDEYMELVGLRTPPEHQWVEECEQDLQDDLERERRGDDRPYGMGRVVMVPGNATNLRRAQMPLTIRWDDGMGCLRVNQPNFPPSREPVQVFTEQEIREALQRTSSYFAGDHVNAGVAIGRAYVELGLERAA